MAKMKCISAQGNRWVAGKEYNAFPAMGDGWYNVLDEQGCEWTIKQGDDGFYNYIPNVKPSATFAIVVD